MSFTLATINIAGSAAPVLIADDRLYPLADLVPDLLGLGAAPTGGANAAGGLMRMVANWATAEPRLAEIADHLSAGSMAARQVAAPERSEDWLAPLQYPAKVICTGANYFDHITKDGGHASFTKADNIPVFFLKPPTTTLVGQGRSVRFPVQSERFDYEVELAVVIGKGGRRIAEDTALDHVAGYTIGLDLSARDWQRHPKHLVKFDLFGGKAFDDSCPLGPGIVPARFVDHADVQLRLRVNGDLRQDANSADMIWSVPELIARISDHVTLEPGDVILTGTPSGVGLATGTWLQVGDVIDCEISGLGSMRVEIVEDREEADRRAGR